MGFDKMTDTEFDAKTEEIVDAMSTNSNFTTPTPALAVVTTARVAFRDAIIAAGDGSRLAHLQKRNARKALHSLMKELAGYVQSVTLGDAEKIKSGAWGYTVKSSPLPVPGTPTGLAPRLTNFKGRVPLKWKGKARSFNVWMSTGNNPFKWELVTTTTKTRYNVDNLTTGTQYWFTVSAVGAAGESTKSDPAIGLAA